MRWLAGILTAYLRIVAVVAFGAGSAVALAGEIASARVTAAARFVEHRQQIPRLDPATLDRFQSAVDAHEGCRKDLNRAAVSVALFLLDHASAFEPDYEQRSAAIERANRVVRAALVCSPMDGSYWLRLAMIEEAIAFEADRTRSLLRLSTWVAPAEGQVIESRMEALSGWAGRTRVVGDERTILSDFRRLVRLARPGVVAGVLNRWGADLPDGFRAELARLSEDRREELIRGGYVPRG